MVELASEAQTLLTRIIELVASLCYDPEAGLPLDERSELIAQLFGGVEPEVFFVTSDNRIIVGPIRTNMPHGDLRSADDACGPGLLFSGWFDPPLARMQPMTWERGERERRDDRAEEPGPTVGRAGLEPGDEYPALRDNLARQRQMGALSSLR